jgi:hypothetical protein
MACHQAAARETAAPPVLELSGGDKLAFLPSFLPTLLTSVSRLTAKPKSKLYYSQWSVGQSILVLSPVWGPRPYLFLSVVSLLMWGTLSDERIGLSFTIVAGLHQRSHFWVRVLRLMTIFYCLRFETPPTWRARSPYLYPPGTGEPSYAPRHWVPSSSPPKPLSGLRCRYLNPPPHSKT